MTIFMVPVPAWPQTPHSGPWAFDVGLGQADFRKPFGQAGRKESIRVPTLMEKRFLTRGACFSARGMGMAGAKTLTEALLRLHNS
jgi:hypothetical protein